MDNTAKNKRIAINTIALYFRMLLATGVALYSSRVILEVLGITDFGIYNVVGGIVVLLSFLQTALNNSIQRYLSFYATGEETREMEQTIYSSSFYAIGLMTLGGIIFCETIGLWMVNSLLNIPPDRMADANIVYQISVLTMVVTISRSPFDALIVAHEKMSFFAISSVVEACLKLGLIFLLYYIPGQKLILYAFLVLGVAVVLAFLFYFYSTRKIPHVKPSFRKDSKSVREILGFSGWNAVSGAALVGYQQGTNIILNIFYGVTLNATMGIANQVKMAAFLLATNLTVAANPQLTKSYALKDLDYMRSLVFNVSKYAYFLIFIVGVFLILNMGFILKIWLVDIPPYCAVFCSLVLVFCMVDCQLGPLCTVAMAEGHIRNYQICVALLMIANVPVSYLALYLGCAPWSIIAVQIGCNVALLLYRLLYLVRLRLVDLKSYARKVWRPILSVTLVSVPFCFLLDRLDEGLQRGLISGLFVMTFIPAAIYLLALSKTERQWVKSKILSRIK